MEQILFKQFDPLIYMYMTQPARTRLIENLKSKGG